MTDQPERLDGDLAAGEDQELSSKASLMSLLVAVPLGSRSIAERRTFSHCMPMMPPPYAEKGTRSKLMGKTIPGS
jgi:hypothetical protein